MKIFVTEVGKTNVKTVVTEVETAMANIIANTPVRDMKSLHRSN